MRAKIRYLVAKPQKGGHTLYYWQPTAVLQAQGFLPRRLAERSNQFVEAIAEAERLNAELDAWRAGHPMENRPKAETLPWLVDLYRKSSRYAKLRENTRLDYEQSLKVILAWSKRANDPPLRSITPLIVDEFYRGMREKAPARANKTVSVLRLLCAFALKNGFLDKNPATNPDLIGRPGRDLVWTDAEIEIFCEAAKAKGRASLALAVKLAVNLGQRESDILSLAWPQYDGKFIQLRQKKTGKLLDVPVIDELVAELQQTQRSSPVMVISETTGKPYRRHNFSHLFREIARGAGLRDELQFLDLRRTAAVRLAEAGCDLKEIAHITGHSYDRVKIFEVYLPRQRAVAQDAIVRLSEHRKRTKLEGSKP